MTRKTLYLLSVLTLVLCMMHEDASAQRRRKKKEGIKLSIYDVDTLVAAIPLQRSHFHDKIDKEQRKADVGDGAVDNIIYYSEDSNATNALTRSLLRDVDRMQTMIENLPIGGKDPATLHQEKIRCLTAVWEMMRGYNADTRVEPFYYRRLVNNMRELIIARQENRSMQFVQENISWQTLSNVKDLFEANSEERSFIYAEMGKREPEVMIKRLNEFAGEAFADPIIAAAARKVLF